MISNCPASKKAGDNIIIDHAQAEMRTFFDELKNGTSRYKTITNLSSQVTQDYQGRCVLELLQNAHDALRNACANDRRRITFKLTTSPEPVLFVGNSGTPFRKKDFKGLCQLGQSPKKPNEDIGNKGLGFKSVLDVSLCPEIYSTAPCGNCASFAFRFDPSICETIAAAACDLVKNGLRARSPFDPRCRLVLWSQDNLDQYRKRLIEERLDVSNEAAKSLSPYMIPLTITNVPHDIEGMLGKEHVTVIRLPLDGGSTGTRERAVRSVAEQLQKIEASSLIFLQHLEELIIDVDGKQRILERVIETEEDLPGYPHTRYRRLLTGSSGPESGHNSTHRIHAWTRVIGGENNPEQAEQIRAVASHLPTQGPDISRAELGVAVEEAPTPGQGAFVIFLPTETKTGTGSHINAPFYGKLDRRHIIFSDDYNKFILEKVLDLCLDAVAELISGEKEHWRAWAAIDLLSSTADVGGEDWQVMDYLHKRASDRNNALEDQALILCDGGWRKPGKARLMPDIPGDSAVNEEYWRGHAEFDVVSSAFDGRQDAVRRLIKQLNGSPDPICSEWIRTIERMAGGIQSRNIGINWNDFLNSVCVDDVLPDALKKVSGSSSDKLANAKFLPDQDERLISATDPAKLFFMPVRGVDDAAGLAESVPECLKQSVAFLHSDIRIHKGRERKNTKVQQFLVGRFVQEFRRDELLKIVRNALPSLPAPHGGNAAKMCSELLIWAMELLDGQGEDSQYQRSDAIKELPVACNGGWYCMNEAVFGPGWPSRHGDEIMSLADELPETTAAQLRKNILLPPDDSRWGGTIKDLNNLNKWFFLGGVIDGLRLQEADEIRHYVKGSSCALPIKRPNETPEDAWQEWRMAVRNEAKSPYRSSFEYSLTDVYLLPEIHHLNNLSSRGRNALSKLVQNSLEQWPEGWQKASIRKCSGEHRSYRIRSPLCHWLSTLPWLHDGTETQLPLSRRWLVPSNFLRGQESRYRHLGSLSLDLVQVLEKQQSLMGALVELGLNRYPVDRELVGPELLEALAGAWSAGKVHQGRFDIFLGQVRHAWQHLDSEKGLPEFFLVKTRQRDFSTRELSELADVYLPDDRDRSRSLSEHKMLVLEMSPNDAKRHSPAFSETGILLASSLAERCVIDGDPWSGETEGIASLDHDPTYSWLPAPLLAIAAHGGQDPRGPTTQNWNDAAERLRRARILKCEDIVVQLVDDDKIVADRQHDARWLPENVLAVRHSVGTSYKKLATAAQMMLNRQDLLKDLQLVLGALDGQDNPSGEQIESALDDIQIESAEFADIHGLWAGTTELLVDRIKPVLRLLQVPSIGFGAASSNIDSLTEWLSSNVENWSAEELLKAARTSLDDHAMGKAAWRSLGDVASLPAWNKALATLGEPYTEVENDNVNKQTEVHIEAAMPLLRSFARHVAVAEGRPQMFHEIEAVSRNFKVDGNWRYLWWEVPFGAVMNARVHPIFCGNGPLHAFGRGSGFAFRGLPSGAAGFSMDRSRGGFRRPAHGGRRASGARAAEVIMAEKIRDAEFRHPELAAFLQGLTDEQAAALGPLSVERDGVASQYWREDGRVRCREFEAASGGPSSEMEALHAEIAAAFGRSLPRMRAELRGGGVPDLDAIETSIRDDLLGGGAKCYAALLEAFDAALPPPSCPRCDRRMDRHGRVGKTFGTRFGPVRVERRRFRCRGCGDSCFPLDPALDLEGKNVTPGAESLYADAASSDSYGQARRQLKNFAGVEVPASTLQRHVLRIGEEMQAFERADAEASPAAERVLLGIDGTGVPMAAREVEGVAGKQADGSAKTREAKVVVCREADSLDPKTGEPRTDRKSGAVSVRIDSARSADGAGRTSEFAARLEQFAHRNGVLAAEEVVVLSDGAPWIRTVCEEILPGRKTTFILDLYHALEYAAAAVQDAAPDEGKRAAWMERIRKQLDAGRVDRVIADLKPYRRLEAVAACIRYYEANRDRMRYDLYRKRGLPVGSGFVESACKRIVGSRLKGAGRHWSKAGANAVLAVKCCFENNRWPDFLDWRACRAAAA